MDNHKTHITVNIVLFARENNIMILTSPPQCSHRLQSLDVTVFGPFKIHCRASMNDWMTCNPGKTVTIYNVSQFAKGVYAAFNITNVTSGFKNTGIYPLNKNIFTENFLPSFVTDRPQISDDLSDSIAASNENEEPSGQTLIELIEDISQNKTAANIDEPQPEPSNPSCSSITPEPIRPYPKAPPQKTIQQRRKGTTKIITETPEKDRLLIDNNKLIDKRNTGGPQTNQ